MPVMKLLGSPSSRTRGAAPTSPPPYPSIAAARVRDVRRLLLDWFASNGRAFFWRDPDTDSFSVLLVEMLLTKTRADLVASVGRKLLSLYPNPRSLARARRDTLER